MTFCTAHRPDYRPAPQPTFTPLADRRRQTPRSKPAQGQIFTDWASI
ncbi:MAG: hypothetical protein GY717_15370 [Rhodobacteraceae bacterium]|nr:hypothetical protein [Paracoccaceae bacterium]